MILLIFLFGFLIGSFLNAVIYRLHTNESIFEKSSRCPHCRHELKFWDLIPVVSFFILGSRCRYCHKSISWRYPLVELATGVAFVLVYFSISASFFQSSPPPFLPHQWGGIEGGGLTAYYLQLTAYLLFTSFLIVIFVYDLKHYLILDRVLYPAALLTMSYQIWQGRFWSAILGAALLSGFFGLLFLASRGRWIGLGDVKLGIFLGLLVPYPRILVVFFLAYFSGAIVSVFLLVTRKKKFVDRVPFGTFLTFAAFVAMLYGERMIAWYFRLIGIG